MDSALHDLDVEVIVVPLPDDLRRLRRDTDARHLTSIRKAGSRRPGLSSRTAASGLNPTSPALVI